MLILCSSIGDTGVKVHTWTLAIVLVGRAASMPHMALMAWMQLAPPFPGKLKPCVQQQATYMQQDMGLGRQHFCCNPQVGRSAVNPICSPVGCSITVIQQAP